MLGAPSLHLLLSWKRPQGGKHGHLRQKRLSSLAIQMGDKGHGTMLQDTLIGWWRVNRNHLLLPLCALSRYILVIPAAGFIKAQAYVPLNHSRWVYSPLSLPQRVPTNYCFSSAHFIDPFLRAILESSFTPDDNDLFLSNLVDTPSLVLHGWVCHVVLLKTPSHPVQLYRRECTYLALKGISKCLENMGS
jgi:hypothetical protein